MAAHSHASNSTLTKYLATARDFCQDNVRGILFILTIDYGHEKAKRMIWEWMKEIKGSTKPNFKNDFRPISVLQYANIRAILRTVDGILVSTSSYWKLDLKEILKETILFSYLSRGWNATFGAFYRVLREEKIDDYLVIEYMGPNVQRKFKAWVINTIRDVAIAFYPCSQVSSKCKCENETLYIPYDSSI